MNKSNYFIIISAAIMMQYHSIHFWIEQVGYSGVGWSLMLEFVVIWYWFNQKSFLAITASLLLLMGPIYKITEPAVSRIKQNEQMLVLNKLDSKEVVRLEASLKTYEKNSQSRVGWSGRIDRIQVQIDINNNRIRDRISNNSTLDFSISLAIAMAQILALMIIMTAQAMAISRSRTKSKNSVSELEIIEIRNRNKTKDCNEIELHTLETSEILPIDRISQTLDIILKSEGITQAQWCKRNNVSPKNLSLAKNHQQRILEKKEVAPAVELKRICRKLKLGKADEKK